MGKAWWYSVGVAMGSSSSHRSSQTHLTINATFWIVLQVVVATEILQRLIKVRNIENSNTSKFFSLERKFSTCLQLEPTLSHFCHGLSALLPTFPSVSSLLLLCLLSQISPSNAPNSITTTNILSKLWVYALHYSNHCPMKPNKTPLEQVLAWLVSPFHLSIWSAFKEIHISIIHLDQAVKTCLKYGDPRYPTIFLPPAMAPTQSASMAIRNISSPPWQPPYYSLTKSNLLHMKSSGTYICQVVSSFKWHYII